jgi:hypothetical protein
MDIPFASSKLAQECRKKSKRLDFFRYPNSNKIQTISKKARVLPLSY